MERPKHYITRKRQIACRFLSQESRPAEPVRCTDPQKGNRCTESDNFPYQRFGKPSRNAAAQTEQQKQKAHFKVSARGRAVSRLCAIRDHVPKDWTTRVPVKQIVPKRRFRREFGMGAAIAQKSAAVPSQASPLSAASTSSSAVAKRPVSRSS